jgi:hypothetical protein
MVRPKSFVEAAPGRKIEMVKKRKPIEIKI